jgi:uncharacterized protein
VLSKQGLGAKGSCVTTALLLAAVVTDAVAQTQPPPISTQWSAPTTVSVVSVEKRFSNGSVELSGTLYAPDAAHKVPAMVVLHDASVPSQDAALYRHLEQMMPPLGMAVFVFDRRGSGKSGGSPANGDFDLLANDGIAAQRMLAVDPRIDPRRIGFWGLSQGGWLSLLAASRSPDAAFAISISAPMTTPDVQMNFAVANILRIKGYSQADIDTAIATRKAVDDYERGQLDRATAQRKLDEAIAKPWFDLIYMRKTFPDPDKSGWAKEMQLDPLKILDSVKAPVLIVFGAVDPWVPVKLSTDAVRARATQHPNVTMGVVAGADHRMMLSVPLLTQIDPARLDGHVPNSPEYLGLIASWLTKQGLAHAGGP